MVSRMNQPGDSARDLYLRLDVRADASREEIVRAYRRLAFSVHPDTHPHDPDAAERFRGIREAYEVLADQQQRAAYDRMHRPPRPPVVFAQPRTDAPATVSFRAGAPPVPDGTVWLQASMADYPGSWTGKVPPLWAGPVRVGPTFPASPAAGGSARQEVAGDLFAMIAQIVRRWVR